MKFDENWWNEKSAYARAIAMIEAARLLASRQNDRVEAIKLAYKIYDSRPKGIVALAASVELNGQNLTREVVDAYISQVARADIRIKAVTLDGDWSLQRTAEMRTGFVDGLWEQTEFREMAKKLAIDSAVAGAGVIKVRAQDGEVVHDRVLPYEIFVDEDDGRDGDPRTIYQIKQMDRETLLEMFPGKATIIETANRRGTGSERFPSTLLREGTELVDVIEGWHRGKKNGRHVIAVSSGSLFDEEFDGRFPFVFLQFMPRLRGFWTESVLSLVQKQHRTSNETEEKIDTNIQSHGFTRVFVQEGTSIEVEKINDGKSQVIRFSGDPPVVSAPRVTSPEVYGWFETVGQKAFQQVGISRMSSSGEIPPGMTAAVAVRAVYNIGAKRLAIAAHAWEKFHLKLAKLDLDVAQQIAEDDPSYTVEHTLVDGGSTRVMRVRFTDIGSADEFRIRLLPTSILSETLGGRIQEISEMKAEGLISEDEAREFLALPDTDKMRSLKNVSLRIADKDAEKMLDHGIGAQPQSLFDLRTIGIRMLELYAQAYERGAPDDRLELVRQYIYQLNDLVAPPQQQEQQKPEQGVDDAPDN